MGEFDLERCNQELDELLADVKELLDEPEPEEENFAAEKTEDGQDIQVEMENRRMSAYEQSKAAYQTAKRAEYERERLRERQLRQAERQRRDAEEERLIRAMEGERKKHRTRKAPQDPQAYSEWLYQQGEDDETQQRRAAMARREAEVQTRGRKHAGKTKRRGRVAGRFLVALVLLLAVGMGTFHFVWAKQPKADSGGLGARKSGCTTILLAGTDEGGYRTDTMLLLSIDRDEKTMSLLSIPRDTLVYCEYSVPKLNSAYGCAGGGEAGMEELLTQVSEIVGFRPDGYVLIDLDCFEELVDLMGGVAFDVPTEMHYSDPTQNLVIDLSPGEQKLNGAQAMQLVRFRSGYADADLGRVRVQREFLSAAIEQWASLEKSLKLPTAIRLLRENTKTDLSSANLAWLAESALLCGTDQMTLATLPGTAAWIGGGSYYVLDAEAVAKLVNETINPYQKEITTMDLSIRVG